MPTGLSEVSITNLGLSHIGVKSIRDFNEDEIIEIKDERVKHEKLLDLKPKSDMILDSVISEKREMVWPAEKKRFGVLHLLKLTIVDCLNYPDLNLWLQYYC